MDTDRDAESNPTADLTDAQSVAAPVCKPGLGRRRAIPVLQSQPHKDGHSFDLSAMDRDLMRQGLLRNRIKESLTFDEEAALRFSTPEKIYEVPRPRGVRRCAPVPSCLEHFGARPKNLKHSHLIDLFQGDHFNRPANESLERVAYLISKGLTDRDVVKCFAPDLSDSEFHKLQAQVHREVEKSLPSYSREFLSYWSELTARQREAMTLYYFENEEKRSKQKIAKDIGISVDALKDRLEGALKKLELHFIPLIPSRARRPGYWKTLFRAPDTRDRGMFVKSSAEKRHPVLRLDPVTNAKIGQVTPSPSPIRTPQPGWAEWKAWQRTTHHRPQHDGTASPLLAHLPNVSYYEADKKLKKDGRTRVEHVTADAKTAFDQLPKDAPKKSKLKKGDPLFDDQWLEQRAIEEREEDDLDMNAEPE